MNSFNSMPDSTKKFDWTNVTRKLSTLVATLATIPGIVMAYYMQLDPMQKAQWPWWVPLALSISIPLLTAFIPAATSYKQKNL